MERPGDTKVTTRGAPHPMEPGKNYVNPGQEDQMEIIGYMVSPVRRVFTWIAIVLTVGLLRLVFHWRPEWMLRCTHVTCPLALADTVLLQDEYKQWFVETIKLTTRDGTRVKEKSCPCYRVKVLQPSANFLKRQRGGGEGDGQGHANVYLTDIGGTDDSLICYFTNKKVKYVWDPMQSTYQKLRGLEVGNPCSVFHEAKGLSVTEQKRKWVLYGYNSITVHVTSVIKLLFTQILNPFYVFQVFSMILWYNDEYYYYATCILIISAISLTVSIYQTRRMQRALKTTITSHSVIPVCRESGEYQDFETDQLVPGDVIEVPRHGCDMQCDAVLISGNCIVNESMLTGESVPVTKTPLPNLKDSHFNMKEHSRHVLFCGTHVIQTRYYGSQKVRAVVIRTGFSTAKGELVRSIMFPKPVDFKFSQDAFKFIGVLALISAIGMIYTLVLMITRGSHTPGKIVLRTLDLITIVIPPALPAAMTVGIVFAQNRLKQQRVFCISPRSINLCGAINIFCFDKTGTLTEDGLDLWGVVPTTYNMFQSVVHKVIEMGRCPMLAAMATCHSLTLIEGKLSGDPLDLKMFEATEWELDEPGEDTSRYDIMMPTSVRPKTPDLVRTSENYDTGGQNIPYEIGILRQFTFSSRLQRMSVIARTLGSDHFDLYAKGAPEMIASLCRPETVPVDFHDILMKYTKQGYRVIALAWRPLARLSWVKIQRAQREQVECNLEFLGLLIMENRLKPETQPTIHTLREADIRTVMITGDNMLTALSVARDCGIVERTGQVVLVHVLPPTENNPPRIEWTSAEDTSTTVTGGCAPEQNLPVSPSRGRIHFAVTGKSWELLKAYFPDLIPKLIVRGSVFARMSPDQKMQLVEAIQEVGYYVGMCGDGANDCGALKAAHAGISLSEAEASVASPFTSQEPNIGCVPTIIREGRAALVTSFGIFKYMACYSLTQFTTVCILYWIAANITDFQFLYVDLFLLTSLSITFGYTHAYPELVRRPPPVSLLSFTPIFSILVQMVIVIAVQVFAWLWTREQPWFEPFVENEDDDYTSHEVTALFCVSSFQYITLAIIFSKGAPYRKTLLSNYYFLGNLAVCIVVTIYTVLYPFQGYANLLELKLPPPITVRLLFVGVALFNFFACFILETYLLDNEAICKRCESLMAWQRRKRMRLPYEQVEQEIQATPEWPPVSASSTGLADILRQESVAQGLPTDGITIALVDEGDHAGRIRSLSSSSSTSHGGSEQGGGDSHIRSRNPSATSATNLSFEPDIPESPTSHHKIIRQDSLAPLVNSVSRPTHL